MLDYIVEKAIEYKLGARGLRSICEAIIIDAMFELPSQDDTEVTISLEYAITKMAKLDIGRLKAA